jgi:hypothetical protein
MVPLLNQYHSLSVILQEFLFFTGIFAKILLAMDIISVYNVQGITHSCG